MSLRVWVWAAAVFGVGAENELLSARWSVSLVRPSERPQGVVVGFRRRERHGCTRSRMLAAMRTAARFAVMTTRMLERDRWARIGRYRRQHQS